MASDIDDDYDPVEDRAQTMADRRVDELIRGAAQAARAIFEREQRTDVVTGIINTLTSRALKATERAGKAEGYHRGLAEELKRQLAVQAQLVAKVAWYERITQIVVGGAISADTYGEHATGIRCDHCHRQVEEHQIIQHLVKHVEDENRELEIKRRADQMRADAARAEAAAPAPKEPIMKKIRKKVTG